MRDRTRTVNVELCVWNMTGISLTVGVRESLLSRLARRSDRDLSAGYRGEGEWEEGREGKGGGL
jgi:hypothetical protein